jgi:hypothetical protein
MVDSTADVLHQFDEAFLRHDPGRLSGIIADDCVLENTGPAPDGSRHVGRDECLAFWTAVASQQQLVFETEAVDATGELGIIRWRLRWGPGPDESVRGVNIMRVRAGQIVEALGYVKGGS